MNAGAVLSASSKLVIPAGDANGPETVMVAVDQQSSADPPPPPPPPTADEAGESRAEQFLIPSPWDSLEALQNCMV